MTGIYIPDRGDIIDTTFDPSAGHEQAGDRPALVLTKKVFNKKLSLVMVVPITTKGKGNLMEVELTGTTKTTGYILCDQVKMMDLDDRGAEFREKAPYEVTSESLMRVRAMVNE